MFNRVEKKQKKTIDIHFQFNRDVVNNHDIFCTLISVILTRNGKYRKFT